MRLADRLLFVISAIKEEIVSRVEAISKDKGTNMVDTLERLISENLGKLVNHVHISVTKPYLQLLSVMDVNKA